MKGRQDSPPVNYYDAHPKKRKRSDNPLAFARRNNKVESLWHRKSGAGFRLFADFYASQPLGVCSDGSTFPNSLIEPWLSSSQPPNKPVSSGQSRASKRRKKKNAKKKAETACESLPDIHTTTTDQIQGKSVLFCGNHKIDDRFLKVLRIYEGDNRVYSMLSAMSSPLPLTFRIRNTVSVDQAHDIQKKISKEFDNLLSQTHLDSSIYQAKESSGLSKTNLAKASPSLKEFLMKGSGNGTIARQEVASMLPVLALTRGGWLIENSRVLDICASPGSKTLQALECVGAKGRLKANDVSASRLDAMRAAIERSGLDNIGSVKYSNRDASQFPIPNRLYDTVLCDVPCSGDGTIRKDPHILPNWTPATSNALHTLQLKILLRSLQCLRVGGVMCYSTCSLNPVENEAVVAAALSKTRSRSKKRGEAAMELVPLPAMGGLRSRPGVHNWKIADYVGESEEEDEDMVRLRWHVSYEDAVKTKMEHATATMWPPNDAESLFLNRCVRLWPQDNDSGGFFLALIRKNC